MTESEIAELKKLAEKATAAPWENRFNGKSRYIVSPAGDAELGNWMVAEHVRWVDDAMFIAACRTAVPALLEERTRLREEYAAAKDVLRCIFDPDYEGSLRMAVEKWLAAKGDERAKELVAPVRAALKQEGG